MGSGSMDSTAERGLGSARPENNYQRDDPVTVTPLSIRREQVLKLADLDKGRGLEIGPLNQVLITKDMAEVLYVDIFSQDHLRAHYALDDNVNVEDIPDIDFVLSGPDGVRSLSEAVQPGAPFSWIIASHVVEHVPDIISWLAQIAQVIEDDAQLLLVVPDRRFSFDILRPSTTVGQMLQAHERKDACPSVGAVYDMFRSAANVSADAAWRGEIPGQDARKYTLPETMNQVELARDGNYVDSHVWTFTPGSFVEQMAELGHLDVCDFVVDAVVPTAQNQLEFFAVLRRLPRGVPSQDLTAARASSVLELVDVNPGAEQTRVECKRLTAENATLRAEVGRLSRNEARLHAEFEDALAQVKASERWRLGGLVVVPASAVKRLFAR
jgi:Methyltransferase domain